MPAVERQRNLPSAHSVVRKIACPYDGGEAPMKSEKNLGPAARPLGE